LGFQKPESVKTPSPDNERSLKPEKKQFFPASFTREAFSRIHSGGLNRITGDR
jgi:hypothetical protein